MRKFIYALLFIPLEVIAQFTYSGYLYNADGSGAYNVPVYLYRRTSSVTASFTAYSYRTHYGTGSTAQYGQFANNATDMGKMVNSAYAATTYLGSLTTSSTSIINWSNASTPRNLGLSIPSNGEYFSVSVTTLFTASETGTYYFGINSDDGSDLYIGGTLVTSYYGGHGMSGPRYGSIYLTKGSSYWMTARMQEYGGGEGLQVIWRKPSGGSYSIWTDEIGTLTWSSWSLYKTIYTNTNGYYSISESATNAEYYITINAPTRVQAFTNTDINNISSIILNQSSLSGVSYHRFDLNDDGKINIADEYYIGARKGGRFSSWRVAPDVRIFTPAQYMILSSATSNIRSSYPGVTSYTTSTLSSGGTLSLYIIAPGYAGKVQY